MSDTLTETALVPVEEPAVRLTMYRQPTIVLEEAAQIARAVKAVIDAKPNPFMVNGERYLQFEDWNTFARCYGIAPRIRSVEYHEHGDIKGYTATAEAIDVRTGMVLSTAMAACNTDEPRWKERVKYGDLIHLKDGRWVSQEDADALGTSAWVWVKGKAGKARPDKKRIAIGREPVPLAQICSMAETRAGSKVLRQLLSWVVVLANYKATPAEEMESVVDVASPPPMPEPPPSTDEPPMEQRELPPPASEASESSTPAGAIYVRKIDVKDTKNPKVKRYLIVFSTGEEVATISGKFYAIAKEAWEAVAPVFVTSHVDQYGHQLDSISLVPDPDVPF